MSHDANPGTVLSPVPAAPAGRALGKRCAGGGLALVVLFLVHRADSAMVVPLLSTSLAVLVGALACVELHLLLRRGGLAADPWLLIGGGSGLLAGKALLFGSGRDVSWFGGAVLLLVLVALVVKAVLAGGGAGAVPRMGATLFGLVYVYAFSYLLDLLLRPEAPDGVAFAFLVVLTAKATDIGGYLVGSLLKGPKLVPRVSPGKTWSGTAGGLALACGVALAGRTLLESAAGPGGWLVFALAVGLAALLGDLAESLLKRAGGVKDSSALVPTFGGVLDLVDSLVLAAPVGYWCLVWLAGLEP